MDILEEGSLTVDDALEHWYYRAKFALLERHLSDVRVGPDEALADVGCGLGIFLRLLRRSGYNRKSLSGVDIGFEKPIVDPVDGFTIYPSWPSGQEYRTILMMDVLEHCHDDLQVLREATDHLQAGGAIFITVPAFQSLWSAHDVYLKHFRRYNRQSLAALIAREPRLEIESLHYFYGLLFPFAALQRWLHRGKVNASGSEMRKSHKVLNAILMYVCRIELWFAKRNILCGVSVVARCRRR